MPDTTATRSARLPKARSPRRRKKVGFTADEEVKVQAAADAAGLTETAFMHAAVLAAVGLASPVRPNRNSGRHALAQVLARLEFQWKKLGTNINQLAHQANAGLVPLRRAEIDYLLNQHQLLFSDSKATLEKLLA